MQQTKVHVADLKIGMYISQLDKPWLDTPFLLQGMEIKSGDDIDALQVHCEFVFIDEDLSDYQPDTKPVVRPPTTEHVSYKARTISDKLLGKAKYEVTKPFENEIITARDIYTNENQLIQQIFSDVRQGKKFNAAAAKSLVEEKVQSIKRNPNAMMWLTHLNDKDRYTYLHSINVSVLAVMFGRYLGLKEDMLNELALAALLHDIGKIAIPTEILNKPSSLTEKEYRLMKEHTTIGLNILTKCKEIPAMARDIAYKHHERDNGEGYPRKRKGKDLNILEKIIAIIDWYDAVTSDRVYRRGTTSLKALRSLYNMAGEDFDDQLVKRFIQCIGIYPVGSIVAVSSGEVGIVISFNPSDKLRPKLLMVLDEKKRWYQPERIVDLSRVAGQRREEYKITRALDPGSYTIDLENYMDVNFAKIASNNPRANRKDS